MNRNDGARGDARKRALSIPEGPGRWLTDDELARVIADAKAEVWDEWHGNSDCVCRDYGPEIWHRNPYREATR